MMLQQTSVALVLAVTLSAVAAQLLGADYCTFAPDPECYVDGWPVCCGDGNVTCTAVRPSCELGNVTSFGGDYCFRIADPDCYVNEGYPICCSDDSLRCPRDKPSCEIVSPLSDLAYCSSAPDTACYYNGWPTCCNIDGANTTCPETTPSCELGTDDAFGGDYCNRNPDYGCYAEGDPICCLDASAKCPVAKPTCEISMEMPEEANVDEIITEARANIGVFD